MLDYWQFHQRPPEQKLQRLWEQDIERLRKAGQLPEAWDDIHEVKYFGGSDQARKWQENLRFPEDLDKEGRHHLEVLLLIWQEDERTGAILQYNLVESASNEMIWELGRTFTLDHGSTWKNITRSFRPSWEFNDGHTPELIQAIQDYQRQSEAPEQPDTRPNQAPQSKGP